jgi:hypothetical protein
MSFQGSRVDGGEYFDDVTGRDDAGVFHGLGAEDYEGIKETLGPDGLTVTMNCRVCGKAHAVTLEWMELFVVGTNGPQVAPMLPRGWAYSDANGKAYPNHIPCSKCQAKLCPMVTPEEARQHVNDALSRGLVQMGAVQQWQQSANMYRQQGG